MKLQNATVLVTGANRGIGLALVRALLGAGVQKVYATARDRNSLEAVTALDSARVIPLQVDVTNHDLVSRLSEQAPDVNLLINNAGVLSFGNILEVPVEKIHEQFDVNFYGALNMARAFVPAIEKNGGGAIVNILTLVALASMPGLATYNASKAAAWSMTQSLRASVSDKNIAVYGVFPGAVDTDMLAGVDMAKTSPADIAKAVLHGIETDLEDIFPDPMSTQLYAAWRQDHKAVEKQFAGM
ncbi:SDR family oxidoreductase [Pseudanabaena sp. UWO311]|uniref:SDR family oxidoreductase n=1 Tax=Pseudanabaena sp. UWO311 TaxID=2487337 RepID=UPI00115A9BBC|nr:SDR family oxidoreductase [Pseudanabaena sp. UWO311]TYQ27766.1 SDR family oxidoreductase [Pseudanabaena sp. UWO311]